MQYEMICFFIKKHFLKENDGAAQLTHNPLISCLCVLDKKKRTVEGTSTPVGKRPKSSPELQKFAYKQPNGGNPFRSSNSCPSQDKNMSD